MLQWSPQLTTDIEVVDTQHEQIFKLIGAYATCCKHQGPSERIVQLALRALIDYSQTHFADETVIMQTAGVDPRHIAKHQMEHRSFIYDVEQFVAQMDVVTSESIVQVSEKLVRFMSAWLIRHIMGTDQAMAAQISAINRGIPADAAFVMHQTVKHDAAASLLLSDSPMDVWSNSLAQGRQLADRLEALTATTETRETAKRLAA